jgi:hypothetical protein
MPQEMTNAARSPVVVGIALFSVALLLCALFYAALAVPGNWFPDAATKSWGERDLALVRGSGVFIDGDLVVTACDPSGITLVSLTSDLRAQDYPAIAWIATDIPEQADVRVLWRSDLQPGRVNTAPINIEAGKLEPVILATNPQWVGHITGIALVIRGQVERPIRIRGVVAKPMGMLDILGDRLTEWLEFEQWSGTSINVMVGGSDVQELPLPAFLGAVFVLCGFGLLVLRRLFPSALPAGSGAAAWIAVFVVIWFLLDARWTWNLLRQARVTAQTYAGKSLDEKHIAAEDGALFAFIAKARAVMPAVPQRVFVVSDIRYFRERAVYHLLPHRAFAERGESTMPPARVLRPGDWLIVYQSRGLQFDPARRTLRWDTGESIPVDEKLTEPGAALFQIR